MLYTIFIFALGVFVGQEYPGVPSVKNSVSTAITYFQQPPQSGFTGTEWTEFIKTYFSKKE